MWRSLMEWTGTKDFSTDIVRGTRGTKTAAAPSSAELWLSRLSAKKPLFPCYSGSH